MHDESSSKFNGTASIIFESLLTPEVTQLEPGFVSSSGKHIGRSKTLWLLPISITSSFSSRRQISISLSYLRILFHIESHALFRNLILKIPDLHVDSFWHNYIDICFVVFFPNKNISLYFRRQIQQKNFLFPRSIFSMLSANSYR